MKRAPFFALSLAALALLGSAYLTAGPLTPPPGPVSSTYKTLSDIEPRIEISLANTPGDTESFYRITSPGAYYLGSHTTVANRHGIKITASNVTIDFRGFRLQGVGAGAFDGIYEDTTTSTHTNIRITNGTIIGFGRHGINLADASSGHHISNIYASANTEIGIRFGNSSTVESCTTISNGSSGIVCFGAGSTIRDCVSNINGGSGIIHTSIGNIIDSTATSNISTGFRAGSGSVVTNCSANDNGFDGFDLGQGVTVTGCSAYSNGAEGIDANLGSTIDGCTANFNGTDGILLAGSGSIYGSSCYANVGDGIQVGNDALVRDNQCDSNGNSGDGAGIHATGSDNRIEGNHCSDNDRGIQVVGAGNIILRNTCASNTTAWVIATNNVYGPILDRRNPVSPPVNGFSAPDSTGSTHPNANFTH